MGCANLAHVTAASPAAEKKTLAQGEQANIAILTAYNDMSLLGRTLRIGDGLEFLSISVLANACGNVRRKSSSNLSRYLTLYFQVQAVP